MYEKQNLKDGYKVLGSGKTILITTFDREKKRSNVMTLAWNTTISKMPFLAGFIIDPYTYTYELIKKEREFVVNIPNHKMGNMILNCGKKSGRNCDKFVEFGIDSMESETLVAPSLYNCLAHLEFEFEKEIEIEKGSIIIARCTGVRTLEETFINGAWNFKNKNVVFLQHMEKNIFSATNESIKF